MQLNNLAEVRDFDIEECINHLEMLHKDSKGYITISLKYSNYKQWYYKIEDIKIEDYQSHGKLVGKVSV